MLGVSCASTLQCVGVDTDGNVVVGSATLYTLSLSFGGSGSGRISGTDVSCPGQCATSYLGGTVVTLTATPAAGSSFAGWSGGGCTGNGTCIVQMNGSMNISAIFLPYSPPQVNPPAPTATQTTPTSTPTAARAAKPPEPDVEKLTVKANTVTVHFKLRGSGKRLSCALVRVGSGKRSKTPSPHYSGCGLVQAYHDLKKGSYRLYVRSTAVNGVQSSAVERTFKIA